MRECNAWGKEKVDWENSEIYSRSTYNLSYCEIIYCNIIKARLRLSNLTYLMQSIS